MGNVCISETVEKLKCISSLKSFNNAPPQAKVFFSGKYFINQYYFFMGNAHMYLCTVIK